MTNLLICETKKDKRNSDEFIVEHLWQKKRQDILDNFCVLGLGPQQRLHPLRKQNTLQSVIINFENFP